MSGDELLRVPVLEWAAGAKDDTKRHEAASFQSGPSTSSFDSGRSSSVGMEDDLTAMPVAMLDHIRLYRQVQLNWQAYDAYARVSLFCGAFSLLSSFHYMSTGRLLRGKLAWDFVPILGCATIFASIQIMLCRLDLRLSHKDLLYVALLLGSSPVIMSTGLTLHLSVKRHEELSEIPAFWRIPLMNFCAFLAHCLHTLFTLFLLVAAWPAPTSGSDAAMLPSKFRSILYIDVFGWLVNPNGPGISSESATPSMSACTRTFSDGLRQSTDLDGETAEIVTALAQERHRAMSPAADRQAGVGEAVYQPSTSSLQEVEMVTLPNTSTRRVSFDAVETVAPSDLGRMASSSGYYGSEPSIAASSFLSADVTALRRSSERSEESGSGGLIQLVDWSSIQRMLPPEMRDTVTEGLRSAIGPARSNGWFGRQRRRSSAGSQAWELSTEEERELDRLVGASSYQSPSPRASRRWSTGRRPSLRRRSSLFQERRGSQERRFGGREAVPMEVMESATRAHHATAATFIAGGAAPSFYGPSRSKRVPGETPWAAFCRGTSLMLIFWFFSSLWTIHKVVFGTGWRRVPIDARSRAASHAHMLSSLRDVWCTAETTDMPGPLVMSIAHTRKAIISGTRRAPLSVGDGGCKLFWPSVDTAVSCDEPVDLIGGLCVVLLLRRGGRKVTLCSLGRLAGRGPLVMRSILSLRISAGGAALRHLAATFVGAGNLRIYGRTETGTLLAFHVVRLWRGARPHLVPKFEVDHGQPVSDDDDEQLLASRDILLSVKSRDACSASGGEADTCANPGAATVRVWNMSTGVHAVFPLSAHGASHLACGGLHRLCAS
eukprot:gnl/TRDRNA2_/TRDRNA2_80971_c1_seq1.p1 gnl/TRDRNA2_/TRDRNA2_80971_c1~~gnl/TRDRNA2_/TRDRNA2_80971_c1_seq1.p1  ORF type:complete len:841 (-),score=69.27 gnl/TRDRNA2_/TRDRNA2_80971_c1_seq1:27-2519(-)